MKTKYMMFLIVLSMVVSFTNIYAAEGQGKFYEEALVLNQLGVFDGKSQVAFEPALLDGLTREEGMKMLAEVLSWEVEQEVISGFSDVSPWAEPYVRAAVDRGVTNGIGNGLFGGKEPITYGQFYTWVIREMADEDVYNSSPALWRQGIEDAGKSLGFLVVEADSFSQSIDRDHTVGILYSLLALTDKDSQLTYYRRIINSDHGKDVPESVKALFERETLSSAIPVRAFTRAGILQVKASDANVFTLVLKSGDQNPHGLTLAVCGKDLCVLMDAANISHLGNGVYEVVIEGNFETGVSYYISSVMIEEDGVTTTYDDIHKDVFIVVNDRVDENAAVTEVYTREELDNYIAYSDRRIGIDFYADWCYYCRLLEPTYEEAAEILLGDIMLLKVDGDEVSLNGFDVEGYPLQLFYDDGKKSGEIPGYMNINAEEYVDYIRGFFK